LAYRLFLLLVASSLTSALPAEGADSAPEISADRIKANVAYLANDRLEGRRPGTTGEVLATEYLADEFKKAGLKPLGARRASPARTADLGLRPWTVDRGPKQATLRSTDHGPRVTPVWRNGYE
jgi:hypothetical protein